VQKSLADVGDTGLVIPVLRACLVAAFLAGVLAAGGCTSSGCDGACAPSIGPQLTYVMTVNGQSASLLKYGHVPSYHVGPGERLVIRVAVIVPRHVTVTALWLGIFKGCFGGGMNGTGCMEPILTHSRSPLSEGSHIFRLHWRVPHRLPGTGLFLGISWSSRRPPGGEARALAELTCCLPTSSRTGW
jgi:hypothetical protein